MHSSSVGIRDAKMNLSKYLKMLQKGAEVIIADRDRPVGGIVPIRIKDLPLKDRIKRLEDRGLIEKKPKNVLKKMPPPIPLPESIAQKFLQSA